MMTPEQRKTVTKVYNHLMDNEKRGWDSLDEYIDLLEYLDDDQLHRDAGVLYAEHALGVVRCQQDHAREACFIPILVEAAGAILELYKETNSLHPKNKYILHYYLAMQQAGMIVLEDRQ